MARNHVWRADFACTDQLVIAVNDLCLISRLLLSQSQPCIEQVSRGEELAVPTTIPIGTPGKAAGLWSWVEHNLRVPACNRHVPALDGRTIPAPEGSGPPDRHPGPVRSKRMARSPRLLSACLIFAILHLVRSPRHLPLTARSPKAALCGAVGHRPH